MSNYNKPANAFAKGNQLYKSAQQTGRPRLYPTPDHLWKASCKYFEYCMKNPLSELVIHHGKIKTKRTKRAMSVGDLGQFIGVSSLKKYQKHPEFAATVARIKLVISHHNYIYAAAGLLKGRIISWSTRKPKEHLFINNVKDPCDQ